MGTAILTSTLMPLHNLHNTAYVYHGCIFIDHLEGNISITQFLIPEVNIGQFTLTMHHTYTQHNTPTSQHITPPHNTTHPPHNTSRHVTTPSFNTSYSNSFTTNLQSQQILNMSLSQGSHHLTAHHTTTQHITPPHSTSQHLTAHHTTTQHITTPSQHITLPSHQPSALTCTSYPLSSSGPICPVVACSEVESLQSPMATGGNGRGGACHVTVT